jgi:MFS family permease
VTRTDPGAARADRVAALLMSVCYAVALFHRTAFQGIDADLRVEFGLSASQSADLAALFFWTYFAVMIPVGLLTDSLGARRISIIGSLVVAGGALLFWQAKSVEVLAAARILIAAGSAAAFVGIMRFVAVTFPERKATYSGRAILMGNLGAIASGAPFALLLAVATWRDVWLGLALFSLGLAGALWLASPQAKPTDPPAARAREPIAELRALLTSPYVWLGVAIQAGLAGAYYAFGNIVGPRWFAAHGFTALASGWEVTVLVAGYGLGAAFWGWVGDMEHRRTHALFVAACGALLCWAGFAALPVLSPLSITPIIFLTGCCCGAFALVYPLIAERHPASHAGGVIACVNCGIPLGAAVLQTVAGRVPEASAPWLLVVASGVAVGGSLMLLHDRRARVRSFAAT